MDKVLVMGMGKSGLSAINLLKGNTEVFAYDSKSFDQISDEVKTTLETSNIKAYFGTDPQEEFDYTVISPGIPVEKAIYKSGRLIGELELAYEHCKGSFVGITGTNGKTTVTTLVGEIYKAAGLKNCVVGNIGSPVTDYVLQADEQTTMVTEISSFQLETIDKFHPHIAAVLNITPDHLDRHGSFEEYCRVKFRICENQTSEDYFIFNADDEKCLEFSKAVKSKKVMFSRKMQPISISNVSDIAYVNEDVIFVRKDGVDIELCKASELQIPGAHNLENALAAAAIAVFAGIDAKHITRVLKSFKGVEHRMEFVREFKGVKYVNDSKGTNPDSSIKAVEATNTPIILIAGGYDKNLDFTPFIQSFNNKVKYLILLGKSADRIAKTALECGFSDDDIIKCSNLENCIASAERLAEKGDTVLLSPACASWDMFNNFEERGDLFKKIVKGMR